MIQRDGTACACLGLAFLVAIAEAASAFGAAPKLRTGNKDVLDALQSPVNFEFVETPLKDVVEFLKTQHRVEIQFDQKSLADVGLKTDVAVTRTLKRISLNSALRVVLSQFALTYVVAHDVVLITPESQARRLLRQGAVAPPNAASTPATKVVLNALQAPTQCEFVETPLDDVVDYLRARHDIAIEIDRRALAEVGVKTKVPVTCNLKGVTLHNALRQMLGQLGLTHVVTYEVLLITSADTAKQLLRQDAIDPATAKSVRPSVAAAKVATKLKAPINLEFVQTPLRDVVEYLKQATGVEIQLDRQALSDIGLALDAPCTLNVNGVPLESALALLTRNLGLTFMVEDEVIVITAPHKAAEERTWTDIQGRQIKAALVRAKGNKVVLLKDGKQVSVPLSRLSAADQAFARSHAKE